MWGRPGRTRSPADGSKVPTQAVGTQVESHLAVRTHDDWSTDGQPAPACACGIAVTWSGLDPGTDASNVARPRSDKHEHGRSNSSAGESTANHRVSAAITRTTTAPTGGYSDRGIKRDAERPPTGLVHGGKTMRPCRGKTRTRRAKMSMTRPKLQGEKTSRPEWRRICHWYHDYSRVSVCGTATRRAGRGHTEAYCKSRRHSICVVCLSIVESQTNSD